MRDLSPMGMLDRRQNRLEDRIKDLEEATDEIPALTREVQLLREAFNRNTNAMYQVGAGILGTGVLGLITALILKGVIG